MEETNVPNLKAAHGDHDHEHVHDENGDHNHESVHDSRVSSFSVVTKKEVDPDNLGLFFGQIGSATMAGKGVLYRSKAIFAVEGLANKLAFHSVMDTCDEEMLEEWGEGEEKVCKMVFIGRDLEKSFFENAWGKMFGEENAPAAKL